MDLFVVICRGYKNNLYIRRINEEQFNKLKYSPIHKNNYINVTNELKKEKKKFEKLFSDHGIKTTKSDNFNIIFTGELRRDDLVLYLNEVKYENNLINFKKLLMINLYYQNSLVSFENKKRFNLILENLDNFWEKYNVIKINLTNKFRAKKFNLSTYNKKILKNNILTQEETNYLEGLESYNERDIVENNFYYKVENVEYNENEILDIYRMLNTEYSKYNFLANLLCSKTHCHLFLKNKKLLQESKYIIEKYSIAFKYFMSYAWLTFILYETLSFEIKDDDIYIFDLETANLLPKFPFTYRDINQNPYSCLLIDEKQSKVESNMLSVDCSDNYKDINGLTTPEEFSRRLNIFCSGKNEQGILEFIDWETCVITGSAICACSPKDYNFINKLEYYKKTDVINNKKISDEIIDNVNENITNNDDNDNDNDNIKKSEQINKEYKYTVKELNDYYDNPITYKNSDIDVICNLESYFDYTITVNELYKRILNKYQEKVIISKVCSGALIINESFLQKDLEEIKIELKKIKNNEPDNDNLKSLLYYSKVTEINQITCEIIKKNYSNLIIKKFFYDKYYKDYKREMNEKFYEILKNKEDINEENIFFICFSEFCDIDNFQIKNLNYIPDNNKSKKIKENEKLFYDEEGILIGKVTDSNRFKIDTEGFKVLEIFRAKNRNFMSTISGFHFSVVRGYWNGKTLKCMPSLVSSSMNNLSHDYKYFASIIHPSNIINKYRFGRERGVIINGNCKRDILLHILNNTDNYPDFNINSNNESLQDKIKKIFGLQHNKDIPLKTFENSFKDIIVEKLGFMNKLKSINKNGSVNPLNKKYIEIFYDEINKINK